MWRGSTGHLGGEGPLRTRVGGIRTFGSCAVRKGDRRTRRASAARPAVKVRRGVADWGRWRGFDGAGVPGAAGAAAAGAAAPVALCAPTGWPAWTASTWSMTSQQIVWPPLPVPAICWAAVRPCLLKKAAATAVGFTGWASGSPAAEADAVET